MANISYPGGQHKHFGSLLSIFSSKDTHVKFWSIDTQSCFYTLADHNSEVYSMLLYRSDTRLLVGSAEMELKLYDVHWLSDAEQQKNSDEMDIDESLGEYAKWTQSNVGGTRKSMAFAICRR